MSASSASRTPEDVLGAHVALLGLLEDLEDLDARQRGLEAAVLEFVGVGHGGRAARRAGRAGRIVSSYELGRRADGRRARPHDAHDISLPALAPARLSLALAARRSPAASRCRSSDNFLGVITPYRIEIVQGNVITNEQIALVKPGLTRAQVRDVLGSPLLADPFHADRWDYVFTIRRQGAEPQRRRVVVLFKDDVLESIDTAAPPAERARVRRLDRHLQDRAQRAAARAHRGAAQGAAGAGAAAAARAARRRRRRAPTRRSSRAHDGAARAAPRRRVAIAGASGRMGRMLIEAVAASPDLVARRRARRRRQPRASAATPTAFLGRPSGVARRRRPARRPRREPRC